MSNGTSGSKMNGQYISHWRGYAKAISMYTWWHTRRPKFAVMFLHHQAYLHPVIRNNRHEQTRLEQVLDYTLGI